MAAPRDIETVIDDAVKMYNSKYNTGIETLKPLQRKAIESLVAGKDALCCLPTGFGKSLIYELLPFVLDNCIVIVLEPLNIIIKQQLTKLGKSATRLKDNNISNQTCYIFSHPEDVVNNKDFFDLLSSSLFRDKKKVVVVDEAHCIIDWGENFRPSFKKIHQLRAVMDCLVLGLSATVTKSGQQVIVHNLQMTNCDIFSISPAKENIGLIVLKRPSPNSKGNNACTPYDYVFMPVLEELKTKLDHFPITIIYCKSIQWIGYGYELARRILGDHFYKEASVETARVVMFHASMEKGDGNLKDIILNTLQKSDSECCIRLVISSIALGMGADLRHVRRVIHAGPPTTMESYVQEIGRAGRENTPAQAILFYNSSDLGIKHVRTEIKNYCLASKCLRDVINEFFGFNTLQKPEICCNLCHGDLSMNWDFGKLSSA